MALNQRQIPRPSDFLGQGRPNMDIKHPQVLTTGRKTDYALDPSASMGSRKAGNPPPHTLTGWARGCGDSGPALPSRPGPPPPHRAPPARCPSLHRWPWRLREDLLEGVTTKCGTVTGGTPWPQGRAGVAHGSFRARRRYEKPFPRDDHNDFSARAPADPMSSCGSLAGAQRVPEPFLPVSKHAGRLGGKGWRGRNSIPPVHGLWTELYTARPGPQSVSGERNMRPHLPSTKHSSSSRPTPRLRPALTLRTLSL